jgi:predicted TIM-barrel fold metal-dependent hydrolase
METARFVDADSHVLEPEDLWRRYLPAKLRDAAPKHRTGYFADEHGTLRFYLEITVGSCQMPIIGKMGMGSAVDVGEIYGGFARDGFQPSSYLRAMDEAGFDRMVLYPTAGLYVTHAPDLDAGIAAAYRRAYNNWLHDFCSEDPKRLMGAGHIDLRDEVAAATEVRRCVEQLGFPVISVNPTPVGRPLYHRDYDRVWATIAEMGVPLGIHVGGKNPSDTMLADYLPGLLPAHVVTAFGIGNMFACAALIIGGVLERHPTLRVVHLESGAGWPAFWLYRLGAGGQGSAKGRPIDGLTMAPVEYFRRQCFISADPDDPGIKQVIDTIGDDHIVVGTDFGHPEGRYYARTIEEIQELPEVSEVSKQKIMWDNPRRLYGIAS